MDSLIPRINNDPARVLNCEPPNEDGNDPLFFENPVNNLDSESKIFRIQKIDKIEIPKGCICDLSNPEKYSRRALLTLQLARISTPQISVKESANSTSTPQIVVKKSANKLKKVHIMKQNGGRGQRFNSGMPTEEKYISHCSLRARKLLYIVRSLIPGIVHYV
jgi:hypothetical protein